MSVWTRDRPPPDVALPELGLTAEVCVVGAGIAGLSVAYSLLGEGREVVVLDAAVPGEGETARTTAQLVTALDRGWRALRRIHGAAATRLIAASHAAAIDRIEQIVRDERIDCNFERVPGHLFDTGDGARLAAELAAAKAAGLTGLEILDHVPGLAVAGRCLRYPDQAQLHPLRYLDGLLRAVQARGGRVFGRAKVTAVTGHSPLWVEIEGVPAVLAESVVIATNTPFSLLALHTKQAAYRSYVAALRVPRGAIPRALWWDLADPFHYVRVCPTNDPRGDLVLVGGEDHRTGRNDEGPHEHYARLVRWGQTHLPGAVDLVLRWSGQILETVDGIGFIGRLERERQLFVVTGDCGNGMTHATIAGSLIADLIARRASPWADVYGPARRRLRALGRFARENLRVGAHYAEWLSFGPPSSDGAKLRRGAGRVVRRGLKRVAVHRDANGVVCERSAVCPHLGCIVAWNAAEKTWDCPCHGSRFKPDGEVLNGPATRALAEADHPRSTDAAAETVEQG